MSCKQRLQLTVEKTFGPCALLEASKNGHIVYTTGAGLVSTVGDETKFRVCAPKLLSLDQKPTLQLEPAEPKSAAKLRINPITCTAVSIKGWTALGETGHAPRVAVWSPTAQKPSVVQIHEFGVHKLAFSPSGDYLATLGTPNDGFLYIWSFASGKPVQVASNRCISDVNALSWLSESTLVTAGVRHLRVWTLADTPSLSGRNILLGDQVDSKFTSVLPRQDDFVVSTNQGVIFAVQDSQLVKLHDLGFEVHSLVESANGDLYAAGLHTLATIGKETRLEPLESQALASNVYLDKAAIHNLDTKKQVAGTSFIGCHGNLVWTQHAVFKFEGCTELFKSEKEITDVRAFGSEQSSEEPSLAVAYTDGTVSIGSEIFQAHAGDGADLRLDFCDGLLLSYGRDNCLQIYRQKQQWQSVVLLGRVSKACFIDASTICVASNKTLSILSIDEHDAFYVAKTIPQPSPVQSLLADPAGKVVVSTLDKKLTFYDLKGTALQTWTPCDVIGEPIVLTNLAFAEHNGARYILASANDKSVVLLADNETVACQWAHTELIRGVAMQEQVVSSVGPDGLFTYRLEEAVPEASTPVRSRSVSPTRILRSPSPTRKLRCSPSVSSLRERTAARPESSASIGSSGSTQQPTRPASPSRAARPASPVRTSVAAAARSPAKPLLPPPSLHLKEPTNLETALAEFAASGTATTDTFKLLCRALDKFDDRQTMRYFSQRLAKHFEPRMG